MKTELNFDRSSELRARVIIDPGPLMCLCTLDVLVCGTNQLLIMTV